MGQVIPFPVERRRVAVQQVMGVAHAGGPGNYGAVTFSTASGPVEIVAASVATLPEPGWEAWWVRVPAVDEGPLWAKLGLDPGATAKRHLLIAVVTSTVMQGVRMQLVALAACGRRSVLSSRFDEEMHGGECSKCRLALR